MKIYLNAINSNFNLTTGGLKELDQLPDPPPIPYMGGFHNLIKMFILLAVAFLVISFFSGYFIWSYVSILLEIF